MPLPEDDFYYVYNGKCYRLTGELADELYYSFIKSKSSFKTLMKNYKSFADRFGYTHSCVKHLLNCFYKLYKFGYYDNDANFEWFLSVVNKSNEIYVESIPVGVFISTGFKDFSDNEVFENDVLIDNGIRYTVIIDSNGIPYLMTSDGAVLLADSQMIKTMIKEKISNV